MAGMYGQPDPELGPNSMGAPEQPAVSLRQIPPSRWAMLVLNVVLFVVCAFAFATSPLVPWYRAPNAGAAPLAATPSATASYAPPTSPPAPAASTTTPTGSGAGGPAPTATPRPTATPTPLGPPTATPTHIAPTATKTPCDYCG